MNAKAIEIKQGLQLIHGSEHLQRIPLLRTCYTEGIKYLAKSADCYWLVTDASVIAKSLMNRRRFITVDFKRFSPEEAESQGYCAAITYSDGNGNTFEEHKYHLTDFPLEELRLFFVDDTLLLPSEY